MRRTTKYTKRTKRELEPIILCGNRFHLPGELAVLGNALSFRVFGVFRGFNCFFQDYFRLLRPADSAFGIRSSFGFRTSDFEFQKNELFLCPSGSRMKSLICNPQSQIVNGRVARPPRFERGTLCLEGRCSIHLSYGRSQKDISSWPASAQARLSGRSAWLLAADQTKAGRNGHLTKSQ